MFLTHPTKRPLEISLVHVYRVHPKRDDAICTKMRKGAFIKRTRFKFLIIDQLNSAITVTI